MTVISARPAPDSPPAPGVATWQATLFFALLTATLTWPQVLHLASVPDNVDSYFSLWRLAWIAHQLPRDPVHLFDANIFYPARYTLAFSDAVLLPGVLGAPLLWIGIPVVVVYNLLVLASFVSCGVGAFLLVRELTGRGDAGVIAGIIFAFATTRFDHYFHLELLWAQWIPLTLWMIHRTVKTGRIKDGLRAGASGAALGFSCIYYTVFLATILVVVAPVLLLGCPRARLRRTVLALAAGALLAAAALSPYLLAYRAARVEVGEREAGLAVLYGAGPTHYIAVTPGNLVWDRVTGFLGRHEKRLFPGAVALLLAVIGLRRFNRTRLAYLLLLAVAVEISFGHRALLFMWLRDHVVLYRGLRVPARAGHVALAGVAVLAGFGVARIATWLERARPSWRAPILACLGGLIVSEYLMAPLALIPVEIRRPPVYQWLAQQPAGVVAEMPLPPPGGDPFHDAEFQYLSTFHWHPLINGYSGSETDVYNALLRNVTDFPSDRSLSALRGAGVNFLILHERHYGRERYAALTAALDRRDDLRKFGPFGDGDFTVAVYRLTRRHAGMADIAGPAR